jgi:N-acetylmuramoyl-L-alanine amidase
VKNMISGFINIVLVSAFVGTSAYAYAEDIDRKELLQRHEQSQKELLLKQQQSHCLALNVYYEARGSTFADKVAVADVVLNRTMDRRYPPTVCEVVQQGNRDAAGEMILNQCQFSWYCDGKDDQPENRDAWEEASLIAWNMIENNRYRGITEGATHYHATYVNPSWASSLQLVGRIGAHIFYRWEK